jgi:hypothetical protein
MHIEFWIVSGMKGAPLIMGKAFWDFHEKATVGPLKQHRPFVELLLR